MAIRPIDHGIIAMSGAGAAGAGYFGGGSISGGRQAVVDKFAFPDDSRSTLGTGLAVATNSLAAMANSGVAGYFGGGFISSGATANIDKFAFADDSRST